MDKCYLCGEEFNETDVVKHGEHIIQQAIGGTLIANDVLCEECGEGLGGTIDVPFNKIFDSICTRLEIRTHRSNNRSKSAKGVMHSTKDQYGNDLSGIEVLWRDGKVAPIKPLHIYIESSNKIIVYGERKQLKNYLKKVHQYIENEFPGGSRPELIICDDINGLVFYPLEIVNDHFIRGMAKIAIGFASMAGVDRKYLHLVMDLKSKEIKKDSLLIPFYPIGALDKIIERHKRKIRNYATHTLILFTAPSDSKLLVCYIELLSTFQWYVILSDSYDGPPVYQCYTQRVDKVEDYIFEPGRRYYKERSMILSSLDITQEEINSAYEKQKNLSTEKTIEDVEFEIVGRKYIEKKYQVSFDEEVKSAIDFALARSRERIGSDSFSLSQGKDILKNMQLFYDLRDDREIFNSSAYRKLYALNGEYHDSVISLVRFYKTDAGRQAKIKYGHEKVYALSEYIEEKNIKDKINS